MQRFLFFLFLFYAFSSTTKAQTSPVTVLAERMADKMRDSLTLSTEQRQQAYAVNLQLAEEKLRVRTLFQNRDSVGKALQRVENTRDSLYGRFLSPTQYELYRQKKRNLVTGN